jgi:hypothetical protein
VIGVHLAFTTSQLDPPDRLAAWRELVNRAFLPLAITPAVFPHAHDLLLQPLIPAITRRRLALPLPRRIIGGGREFQDRADRLYPEPVTV